jgi:pimeloyl-ACP methyl ester carboxylesterase
VIHIEEFGSGHPLLLLHGAAPGATGLGNFRDNVARLSENHRVLVADLPGSGQSPALSRSDEDYFTRVAEGVREELATRDALGTHIVGMATGAAVAIAMGAAFPKSVDKLILVGPPGGDSLLSPSPSEGGKAMRGYFLDDGPSREKMRNYLSLTVADPDTITDEILEERYSESIRHFDRIQNGQSPEKPVTTHILEQARQLRAKCLVVWGLQNRLQVASNALQFLSAIPDAQLHIFKDAGLWVPFEVQPQFDPLVLNFLAE